MNPEPLKLPLVEFCNRQSSQALSDQSCQEFGPSMDLFDLLNPDLKGLLARSGFVEFYFYFVHITLLYPSGYISFK